MTCCLLGLAFGSAAEADPVSQRYGQRISTPETMRPELKAAVDDLQEYLKRITGKEYSASSGKLVEGDAAAAILLRRADAADVPAAAVKMLPKPSREAFCLWPDDTRLWIVARSDLGLSHAVYVFLEQLGCRWYFPSDSWTIVPKRDDILLQAAIAQQPAFRSRLFSGTGGFGGHLPLDKNRTLQARWTDWERRNRFGGEFRVSGHTGEAFNKKYRKQLEAHPEWRAMIDGKRVPWSEIAKFCAGNKEVVDLYVKDRVEDLQRRRKYDPVGPHSWAVSVEPADGGGHCTAPESLAIGSVSDRVFHVANQVAKAVRREFPDGHVSLFAYNEHAAVPSIPIEPNVYVQVIPYAFQRTGLSPDGLLDAWSRKVLRMGIYDYWSIPDWSHDLPDFDPLVYGPERLRGWHRRGVDSFLCESTYSSGAMGLAWYICSRLSWQPDTKVQPIFNQFLQDCFGPASAPMRRMLLRWSKGYYPTSHELALSYRDVEEAWKLAKDHPKVVARVADYGRYVEYLGRRFEYLQTARGSSERRKNAQRLMEYLWSIYDSSMIHAFRHSQLLARDERIAGRPELSKRFDWTNHDAPGWPTIRKLSDDDVRRLTRAGVPRYQPQDFVVRRFTGSLVRLANETKSTAGDDYSPVLWLSNSLDFTVQVDQDQLAFRPRIATEKPIRFTAVDSEGKQVSSVSVETGKDWQKAWSEPEIEFPRPGQYRLRMVSQKRMFRLSVPADLPISIPGWWNSQGTPTPRLYFYVPREISRLAIYANYIAAGPPRFFDPEGKEVAPVLIDDGHLQLISIPPEHRGAVWSLDRAK